jgi:hypothetical protein
MVREIWIYFFSHYHKILSVDRKKQRMELATTHTALKLSSTNQIYWILFSLKLQFGYSTTELQVILYKIKELLKQYNSYRRGNVEFYRFLQGFEVKWKQGDGLLRSFLIIWLSLGSVVRHSIFPFSCLGRGGVGAACGAESRQSIT